MSADTYYKEELAFLREGMADFAKRYPALAPMFLSQGSDPDVERILEGTAFLCARIHERLDQNSPELIQSLLRLVFPQALLPIPSTTLIRFILKQGFSQTLHVPKGAQLASNPVDGVTCLYATTHDLTVLPLSLVSVTRTEPPTNAQCLNVTVTLRSAAPLSTVLRAPLLLHLAGAYPTAAQRFYCLLTSLDHVEVRIGSSLYHLPASVVREYPFPPDDPRLPRNRSGNRSYTALLRYFYLPEQLLFLQVQGIERLPRSESDQQLELTFCLRPPFEKIPDFSLESFCLNVVPAANIFPVSAEPLVVDHTQEEYFIRPQDGQARSLEILSVDKVTALLPGGKTEVCHPYESFRTEVDSSLYSLRCRPSPSFVATDHLLTPLYRPGDHPDSLEKKTLSIELRCCNHTLPDRLRVGDICRSTDTSPSQAEFSNIIAPTAMLPRPQDETLLWRFLSHINTNLLSLASAEALRSLLQLHIFNDVAAPNRTVANNRRCAAVKAFSGVEEDRLFHGRVLRGRRLHLTLDPAGFVSGGDLFLFANALDRFFSGYTTLNSYSRLVLEVAGTGEHWEWLPRLGEKQLL